MNEAMKPTPPPFKFTVAAPTTPKVDNVGEPKRRGRGRPPGAKNRIKETELGRNPDMAFNTGPSGKPPSASEEVDKNANIKAEKKARAEEYSKLISEELNDKLFMVIVALTNGKIAFETFYKEGEVPPSKKKDSRLSEMGQAIAIPPDVADSWGKLLAELSYTNPGKGIVKFVDNNPLGILGAALAAAFSTFQYTQTLKPVVEYLKNVSNEQPPTEPSKEE